MGGARPPIRFSGACSKDSSRLATGGARSPGPPFIPLPLDIGDFSNLLVGLRTNVTIEVSRVGTDDDTSAWQNLQVLVRAYWRGDIALMRPDHFVMIATNLSF